MAITLRQSPDLHTPAYNPIVFVLDSSNTSQNNFKYIADIYISGSTGRITRMSCQPDPIYTQGLFDVGRILESYLSSDPAYKVLNGFQKATNSLIAYEVKFGEQYGVASAVTTYPDLTVTGTMYSFNGAYTSHDWLDFDGTQIAVEDSGELLNESINPQYSTMTTVEDRYLHYITNTSGSVYFAEIKTYDINTSLIQTVSIENPYQAVTAYDQRRMIFYAGARALNAATLYSGSQPVINDTVYSYNVFFRDYAGNSTLNSFERFVRNTDCQSGRFGLTVHWKNLKGAFDSYEFVKVNRYKSVATRDTYRKKLGTMTNNSWSYLESDAGKVVHDNRVQDRFELQSDFFNIDDSLMLMTMITSPEIYIDDGGGLRRCVIISPTEAEFSSVSFGDIELKSIRLVLELSQEYNRQRG